MNEVFASKRVETRHPEQGISKDDAVFAWHAMIECRPRLDKNPDEYIAIGIDRKGRAMELVAVRNSQGDFLIYHAFIPPQPPALRELGLI